MDIFSLAQGIRPTAEKVIFQGEPVAYSYGNENALLKWLANMNGRQVNKALKMSGSRKYPLIWLVQGWEGEKQSPGYRFNGCEFYISVNSEQSRINENREPEFEKLYQIANDFIKQVDRSGLVIGENSITWTERANFGEGQKNKTIDVWDTLILTLDIIADTNCFKNLKNN